MSRCFDQAKLTNNAGILKTDSFGSLDYEAMLEQFRANALGPLRVTEALVDNLKEGSKVAIVSSRVGSIADNGSGGNYGYREAFLTAMATALGWPTSITAVCRALSRQLAVRGLSGPAVLRITGLSA